MVRLHVDIPTPCILLQVGLAGPSGSGKTAFSEKVRSFIPGCTVLSMDNYNDASRLIDGNFDGELIELFVCQRCICCHPARGMHAR